VGDIPIEVSDGLYVSVVGGCESWATTSASGPRPLNVGDGVGSFRPKRCSVF